MGKLVDLIRALHNAVFGTVERLLDGWFLGFFMRFVFASVLLLYYLNSALTKVNDGLLGFFTVADAAYYQIIPSVIEAAGYDVSKVAFFPWKIMVFMGTYSEFFLPILIVLGLFTRVAAFGMIVFIVVQSYVDVYFHSLDAASIGHLFDRIPNAVIFDQRLLWLVPLIYLVVKGAGLISIDALLNRRYDHRPG